MANKAQSILKQAITDGILDGTEPKEAGELAWSYNEGTGVVAIGSAAGWFEMPAEDLRKIAEAIRK